jgi:hypothetical protein
MAASQKHFAAQNYYYLDALFPFQLYLDSKFCPSLLETVGLRVPSQYIRDIALFSVYT